MSRAEAIDRIIDIVGIWTLAEPNDCPKPLKDKMLSEGIATAHAILDAIGWSASDDRKGDG